MEGGEGFKEWRWERDATEGEGESESEVGEDCEG